MSQLRLLKWRETFRVICESKIPTKLKQILIYCYIFFMVEDVEIRKTGKMVGVTKMRILRWMRDIKEYMK